MTVSALTFSIACDRFARVEVNNDTTRAITVSVNGRTPLTVPARTRAYTGPGVNERLRTLDVAFADDPSNPHMLSLSTYDDDLVVHVSGPPLTLTLTHEGHPSATRAAAR